MMEATRSKGLVCKIAMASTLVSALSACSSVEYTSQAELTAARSVVPLAKPASEFAFATPATPEGAQATAVNATVAQPGATEIASAAIAPSLPSTPATTETAIGSSQPLATAYAEMPLTAEMTAIQSAVPVARPASMKQARIPATATMAQDGSQQAIAQQTTTQTPTGTQLAYAGPIRSMDSMTLFDTSAPSATPLVPPQAASLETGEDKGMLHSLISKYSKIYQVPEDLVHRVVRRESTYNPKAYHHGNYGLMQIRYNTARGLGYTGKPAGLLDAETNLKYAVKYLRGAFLVADSNHDQAVRLYSRGYYYDAKRKGMLDQTH